MRLAIALLGIGLAFLVTGLGIVGIMRFESALAALALILLLCFALVRRGRD